MAVPNSILLSIGGMSSNPAIKNARMTAGPAISAAKVGNKKKPLLSVAPVASAKTPNSPRCF